MSGPTVIMYSIYIRRCEFVHVRVFAVSFASHVTLTVSESPVDFSLQASRRAYATYFLSPFIVPRHH